MARSSPNCNETSEVVDEGVDEAVITVTETVGTTVIGAMEAIEIQMTGRSAARMIVPLATRTSVEVETVVRETVEDEEVVADVVHAETIEDPRTEISKFLSR